jgi:hypothetical protein
MLSLIYTLYKSLRPTLSLLSLLCLQQLLLGSGSQQCPLLLCSHPYQLATVLHLTYCSSYPTLRVRARATLRLAVYHQSVHLGAKPLETHCQNFYFKLNTCSHSPYVTSSLVRWWVCRSQLLLAHTSAFILRSKPRRTHDHILRGAFKF